MMDPATLQAMAWEWGATTDHSDGPRNTTVRLQINGQSGPLEFVRRHPNGGFMLYSHATIWTTWETTFDEEDMFASEEYLAPPNAQSY